MMLSEICVFLDSWIGHEEMNESILSSCPLAKRGKRELELGLKAKQVRIGLQGR